METQTDFREWLALLNNHKVEYVIAGAHALAFHGAPRFTGDLDVYVRPAQENAQRLLKALAAFGFGELGLRAEDFLAPGVVVQLGRPPVRIDLLTTLTGLTWEEAEAGAEAGAYGGVSVRYLGRAEFIANKRATGRAKDLADAEALEAE